MPGRGSYGPAGKWIHDRAHGIMDKRKSDLIERYGEKKGKSIAYALATQQAHKVKKSPKGFRTSTGVRVAKAKLDRPLKEYKKTAGLTRQEKTAITNKSGAIGGLTGMGLSGLGAVLLARKIDKSGRLAHLPIPAQMALGGAAGLGSAYAGLKAGSSVGRKLGRRRWKKLEEKSKTAGVDMNEAMVLALLDELDEIEKDAGWLRKTMLGLGMAGALTGGGKALTGQAIAAGAGRMARPAITQAVKKAPSASRLMMGGATRQASQLRNMGVMP